MRKLNYGTTTLQKALFKLDLPDAVRLIYRLKYHGHNSCRSCHSKCSGLPCLLFPSEAKRLIAAGLGDRLMLETVSCIGTDIEVLSAASVDFCGVRAPLIQKAAYAQRGRCTFLTQDRKACELVNAGLKRPAYGRIRACVLYANVPRADVNRFKLRLWESAQIQAVITFLWNRPYGRYLISSWKERWCDTGITY